MLLKDIPAPNRLCNLCFSDDIEIFLRFAAKNHLARLTFSLNLAKQRFRQMPRISNPAQFDYTTFYSYLGVVKHVNQPEWRGTPVFPLHIHVVGGRFEGVRHGPVHRVYYLGFGLGDCIAGQQWDLGSFRVKFRGKICLPLTSVSLFVPTSDLCVSFRGLDCAQTS